MSTRSTKSFAGFTLVEILIALVVTGILLAAVAVAFNASITNYQANEDIFKTINKARQALYRITTQLRTATAVDPNSPDNECALITAAGYDITYRYDVSDSNLYVDVNSNSYALCDNVTDMNFIKYTAVDEYSVTYVKSVQISMTVESGDIERTVSAAAVIRKNLP